MGQKQDLPYTAYAMKREGRTTGRLVEIGEAEDHPDGKGFDVILDRLPIGGFSGRILVRRKEARPDPPSPEDLFRYSDDLSE